MLDVCSVSLYREQPERFFIAETSCCCPARSDVESTGGVPIGPVSPAGTI
jgi:hypothetical protein